MGAAYTEQYGNKDLMTNCQRTWEQTHTVNGCSDEARRLLSLRRVYGMKFEPFQTSQKGFGIKSQTLRKMAYNIRKIYFTKVVGEKRNNFRKPQNCFDEPQSNFSKARFELIKHHLYEVFTKQSLKFH